MLNSLKKLFGSKTEKGTISKKAIASYLPNNPVIVEAGAFNGDDSLALSKQFPLGQIHAFEPIPEVYKELSKKVKGCNNVTTYQLALGGENGTTTMYLSGSNHETRSSSSLLKPKEHLTFHEHIPFKEEITVKVMTIGKWAKIYQIPRIDFMWLDMQGNELTALKAAPAILKGIKVIYTEVSLIETYEGVPLYEEYQNWLIEQGFEVKVEASL